MRSMLFVPGDSERKLDKAFASGADAVIVDLEDSVAADAKEEARRVSAGFLAGLGKSSGAGRPQVFIRVNALDTGQTADDLAALMFAQPAGVMQPKTGHARDVQALSEMLDGHERGLGRTAGETRIVIVATETAGSLFHMGSYVDAGPRLTGITWGAEDLSADLGATSNRTLEGALADPYRLARTLCLLSAVAAGAQPIDTVFTNFRDEAGLEAQARAAARDGFTAKMAIHPAQVAVINEVFTPSADEVAQARRVVDAFAQAGDAGVVGLDGEMLDRPHLRRARALLARADPGGEG